MSELFPPVEITCLDRPRWLFETLLAQMKFEQVSGKPVSEFDQSYHSDLVCRLWGLLYSGDYNATPPELRAFFVFDLTIDELGLIVNETNVEDALNALLYVLTRGAYDPYKQGPDTPAETPEDPAVEKGEVLPFIPSGSDSGESDAPITD